MNKGKIYLKKIGRRSGNDIWLVDGNYIRQNIDENFVGFDQHYRFKFIPPNEFWIERETDPKEWRFFINRLLFEKKMMSLGKKYQQIVLRSVRLEKRDRSRSALVKRFSKLVNEKRAVLKLVHKKLFKKYSNRAVKVWLVNGLVVRGLLSGDYDYLSGGHDKIYPFVPKGEVWIEQTLSPKEREFIILHELHERFLMISQHKTYRRAHAGATEVEAFFRRHPVGLAARIKQEMANNNSIK